MVLINNTLIDQYGRAVPAAMVWIRDDEGALVDLDGGNPVITDSIGAWSAELDSGTYELVMTKGDDFISRAQVVCGLPTNYLGIYSFGIVYSEMSLPGVSSPLSPIYSDTPLTFEQLHEYVP